MRDAKSTASETDGGCWGRISELCIDAGSVWMLGLFPGVKELVVWSWPGELVRQGGLTESETTDGWRSFLFGTFKSYISFLGCLGQVCLSAAGLNTQAPGVREVEVGGLSVYDVNVIFPVSPVLYVWFILGTVLIQRWLVFI